MIIIFYLRTQTFLQCFYLKKAPKPITKKQISVAGNSDNLLHKTEEWEKKESIVKSVNRLNSNSNRLNRLINSELLLALKCHENVVFFSKTTQNKVPLFPCSFVMLCLVIVLVF